MAAVAAIGLVVEDLYVFATGGDSLIGRLLGGGEQAEAVRAVLLDLGAALQALWRDLAPVLTALWTELGAVLKMLWTEIIRPILP